MHSKRPPVGGLFPAGEVEMRLGCLLLTEAGFYSTLSSIVAKKSLYISGGTYDYGK